MLLIANHKPSKLTVHYNKYEHVWNRQVYSIQVYSTLYCLHLQVYKFIVHQIVYSKLLVLTSHWPISGLLHFCTVDSLFFNQSELLHFFTADSLFFNQSESYYTFCTVVQPINELLHFCTVYMYKKNMLQHYLAFIALLLMELNYGLWYSHMISIINSMVSSAIWD